MVFVLLFSPIAYAVTLDIGVGPYEINGDGLLYGDGVLYGKVAEIEVGTWLG